MTALYYLNVSLHVLAAIFWVGGMFFIAVIGAPMLRTLDAPTRGRLFRDLGRRFRSVSWVLIAVLILTGVLNLEFRGLLSLELLTSAAFWRSGLGGALAWKLAGVTTMLLFSVAHDFIVGPASSRHAPRSAEGLRSRSRAAWLARLNAVAAIVVVVAAVRLARGG